MSDLQSFEPLRAAVADWQWEYARALVGQLPTPLLQEEWTHTINRTEAIVQLIQAGLMHIYAARALADRIDDPVVRTMFQAMTWSAAPGPVEQHSVTAETDLLNACRAAEQCIVDFLDAYTRQVSFVVLDQAVLSLRYDALPRVRRALRRADELQKEHHVSTQTHRPDH